MRSQAAKIKLCAIAIFTPETGNLKKLPQNSRLSPTKIILFLLILFTSPLSWAAKRATATEVMILPSLQMRVILTTVVIQATAAIERSLAAEQQSKIKEVQPQAATPPRQIKFLSSASSQIIAQGTKLSLNGRIINVAWTQWQLGTSIRTGISDVGLQQNLGIELLSNGNLTQQPIQWFTNSQTTPIILPSQLTGANRYLDITDLAKVALWQVQADGDTLYLSSVPARVVNIRTDAQPWGFRIVLDLDRPTPWQVSDRRTEGIITLTGLADPALVERFNAPPPTQQQQGTEDAAPIAVNNGDQPVIRLTNELDQATLQVTIPAGLRLQVFSLPNPNRLVIDLRPDAMIEKDIFWAPGIRWRQKYVKIEDYSFPVVWLEIEPRTPGLSLRPIWANPQTQTGTAPLIETAQLWQASAAINAGFFNRNNQLPLGAIRRDGRWFSGPILNRGVIGWNDSGQFKIGRLSLTESLITSTGERLPILFINSGYVQAGISRYTPEWGTTYTPLTDNEIIILVENNQIIAQQPAGSAGQQSFPIPANGYLLTLRSQNTTAAANLLSIGSAVQIESRTVPDEFSNYPQILGAGPLLVQNRQIVLDAKTEQFSDAFSQQAAVRSAIATTPTGTIIIAAIHNRVGGRGPTLTETAQLMQKLGASDALNLDGGSSTGLYLGGFLLDRSAYTAARVHNGLGIFRVGNRE